ncbi:MAG TPA: tRNA pseudouridine(55) synthase TruB [Candidatus Saccharimonadales bacterium]|nr:tRNA pseudouridine(55) synthase TruB [Candidatus Saccharimonadales bacterium]
MKDGIVLIDKPAGVTSFGVVARVRRVLSLQAGKKVKVGHTGTLDPFATGLMILVIGKECKNAGSYSKLDKEYLATIRLGQVSSTGDPEGEIRLFTADAAGSSSSQNTLRGASARPWRSADGSKDPVTVSSDEEPESSVTASMRSRVSSEDRPVEVPSMDQVEKVLQRLTGQIKQTPPQFSAIKIGGQRAYKLARKGEKVDIPKRQVTIYELELLDYNYPSLKIRAKVSSGTYIRALAEDIGQALGTGAYCQELRRTKVADWSVDEAKSLGDLGINN